MSESYHWEWGDNDFSSLPLDAGSMVIANQNPMTVKATGAAAYNALDGDPKSFLIEPRLEVKEQNYWVFKRYKATVHAHVAKKSNYRQVKRYTTDKTETLPLHLADQEYHLYRGGSEAVRIVASNNLRTHVADTIRVIATDKDIGVLNVDASSPRLRVDNQESKAVSNSAGLDEISRRLLSLERNIQLLQSRTAN